MPVLLPTRQPAGRPPAWRLRLVWLAAQGFGLALLLPSMFAAKLRQGRLARPFALSVSNGCCWLTRLRSRAPTRAMTEFRAWLRAAAGRH